MIKQRRRRVENRPQHIAFVVGLFSCLVIYVIAMAAIVVVWMMI